ncbi:MAG: preprotein translocase subunit SecY [Patescibacteria group bacterium]|nr:preprotein translocase subunit SecY [Patescibacteria group bacterium]
MKRLQHFLNTVVSNKELRKKLLFTAGIFAVFRLLAHIPVPAVDVLQLQSIFANNQFLSLLNIFSGGTLANFSVVAVGINPYITASIVMQLAAMVIPQLKEMQKDSEQSRERLNQFTRLASVPLAVVQSISVLVLLRSQNLLMSSDPLTIISLIITLVAGALIVMWLGELISLYGLGNGISMILLGGIISQLPVAAAQLFSLASSDQILTIVVFGAVFLAVIGLIVYMTEAVRKVPIQYAKRVRGSKVYGGQQSHFPIKVNVAGVLPIIFAVTFMIAPSFIAGLMVNSGNPLLIDWGRNLTIWSQPTHWLYMVVYFLIVFSFTYFSALIFFNAEDISSELKKSGAFVPGIRPGGPTKKFLQFVVTRITLVGATYLGFVAILPSLAQVVTNIQSLAIGGTGVLIVVSVILETAKQAESMVVEQNYDKYI